MQNYYFVSAQYLELFKNNKRYDDIKNSFRTNFLWLLRIRIFGIWLNEVRHQIYSKVDSYITDQGVQCVSQFASYSSSSKSNWSMTSTLWTLYQTGAFMTKPKTEKDLLRKIEECEYNSSLSITGQWGTLPTYRRIFDAWRAEIFCVRNCRYFIYIRRFLLNLEVEIVWKQASWISCFTPFIGRIQIKVLTTLPFFFRQFLVYLDNIWKSKLCNQ